MSKGAIIAAALASLALAVFAYSQYGKDSSGCSGIPAPAVSATPEFVATIAPLAAILREVCGGRAKVHTLLKPGASPHTYEPVPSDLKRVMQASGLFYVDERLDGWATNLQSKHPVKMMELVPEDCLLHMEQECCPQEHAKAAHVHSDPIVDPHFWLDPCVVRDSLPGLVDTLCELDPSGRPTYEANARRFREHLTDMDSKIHSMIDPLRGSRVATTHPSFQYLCNQYGLEVALVVTDSPGKEPSPKQMESLVRQVRELGIQAIYSEPQIPQHAAKMLSEASGVPLYELDPVGGCSERCEYDELILYNAQVLVASLN